MSAARRSPPTRHALLRVRRRLDRVDTAAELLGRKRKALVGELFRAARPVLEAREGIQWQSAVAWAALLQARADRGAPLLEALARPLPEIALELSRERVWGLPLAEIVDHDPVLRSPWQRSFLPGPGGPATTAAAEAFEELTRMLLEATSRELRIRRLAHALEETSRRANLLERRVAPSLQSEAERIAASLEEREREEQLRYRRLVSHSRSV